MRYHQPAQYPTNLALALNITAAEPWFLLTDLRRAAATVCLYELRFRCEELFRDFKDQLHLETIRVTRVERLLFCLAMTCLALTLIGVACQQAGMAHKVAKDKVSPAWMALRLLSMPWLLKPRLVKRALTIYSWALNYESG